MLQLGMTRVNFCRKKQKMEKKNRSHTPISHVTNMYKTCRTLECIMSHQEHLKKSLVIDNYVSVW